MKHDAAQVVQPVELPVMHHDNDNNKKSTKKSRRARQGSDERAKLLRKYDDALARLGRIEADAGPALQRDLGRSKRVQAAHGSGSARKNMALRRLGQRAALHRLMQAELGDDPAVTDQARLYVSHMLRASVNAAAISGSGWPSARAWLRSRLPAMMDAIGPEIEAEFVVYLAEARTELAGRIPSGDPNLYTGPTPAETAETLNLTTDQLRRTRANRCGLTSVDPQDRRSRNRDRKERERRKAGMKPQSERTTKAELQALADRLGCSLSKVYRLRRAGTLDAFVAAHDAADTNLSPDIKDINGGHFGVTAANDDTAWSEPFVYLGQVVGVLPEELEAYEREFPGLDILSMLPEIDAQLSSEGLEPQDVGNMLADILRRRYAEIAAAA